MLLTQHNYRLEFRGVRDLEHCTSLPWWLSTISKLIITLLFVMYKHHNMLATLVIPCLQIRTPHTLYTNCHHLCTTAHHSFYQRWSFHHVSCWIHKKKICNLSLCISINAVYVLTVSSQSVNPQYYDTTIGNQAGTCLEWGLGCSSISLVLSNTVKPALATTCI